MKHTLSFLKRTLSLVFILLMSGCGIFGGTTEPEPITLTLTISASKKLNPDIEKRASPIVIRIYQLTQIDAFNNADFFALYENDHNLLTKDLNYREEIEIKPGQLLTKPLEINLTSKYIAVLAAFRDLDKAQWKSFIEIDPVNAQPLTINLNAFNVSIKTDIKDE